MANHFQSKHLILFLLNVMWRLQIFLKHRVNITSSFENICQRISVLPLRVVGKNFASSSRLIWMHLDRRNFYIILWRSVENNIMQIFFFEVLHSVINSALEWLYFSIKLSVLGVIQVLAGNRVILHRRR